MSHLQHISPAERKHHRGAKRANSLYVLGEVRTNLLAWTCWGTGAVESCSSKPGCKWWTLGLKGSPARSPERHTAAAECQLRGQLWSPKPAEHTLCLCKHCGILLLFPPEAHCFCQKDFSDSSPCLSPIAITCKLFALSNWEGMGRASQSLTFCSKSFLCPSGLVKFGQAFLLPFGPWQITHHFRFGTVKRKGTVVPPAAESLKCRSPPASGIWVCRLSIKKEFSFGPHIDLTFRETTSCKDSTLSAF